MEGNTHAPNETKIAAAFHQGDAFFTISNAKLNNAAPVNPCVIIYAISSIAD